MQLAVAANFVGPAKQLAAEFARSTGHTAQVTPGATGVLYAQITNGAPIDILLAADTATPERLEREAWAVPGTRRIYARGELVLWSASAIAGESFEQVLSAPATHKIAIANPKLAPYGATAQAERLKSSKAAVETQFYDWLLAPLTEPERAEFARVLDVLYQRCKAESKAGFPNVAAALKEGTSDGE